MLTTLTTTTKKKTASTPDDVNAFLQQQQSTQAKPASAVAPASMTPAASTAVGTSTTGALPKIDYGRMLQDKTAQVDRQNAVRTKQAVDSAKEQAYQAGAPAGTADYASFLTRAQAPADAANMEASQALGDYGLTLAQNQESSDRQDLQMMLDSVGDDPDAKRKLYSAFLNGESGNEESDAGSLQDAYRSLLNPDGSLATAKTDYDKALASEMEFLAPAAQDPESEYYGMTDENLRRVAADRILYAHDDQYRDMENERNLTSTVDQVAQAISSGDWSGIDNGDIHSAIKYDDTGVLRDSITSVAVGVAGKKDRDFAVAAKTAGVGGFVMDGDGTLYRVVSNGEFFDVDTGKIVKKGFGGGGGSDGLVNRGVRAAAGAIGKLF